MLDATCDRIGDGAMFCGLLWWAAFGMHSTSLVVATMICLVTSQVISYIKARAEASGLHGDGGLIERPERLIIVLVGAGLSGVPFLHVPWLVHVGDVGARGGQPGHGGAAVAHRAHVAGRDGAAADRPSRRTPASNSVRRASRDQHPGGTDKTDADSRFSLGGQVTDLGLRRGLASGARDAGVRGAQRFRRRSAATRRAAAGPSSCARTWPGCSA